MPTDVIMPQMGESIFEGTITKWLKAVGDSVERDEPLFEISTDKVDAEVPSPVAGVLSDIRSQEGSTVEVNTVVAVIGGSASEPAAPPAPSPQPPAENAASTAPSAPPPQKPTKQNAAPAAPPPASAKAEAPAPSSATTASAGNGRAARHSPLVRRIAKDKNVDLSQVQGTGTDGRITKEDVLHYISEQRTAAAPPAPAAAPQAPAREPAPAAAPVESVPPPEPALPGELVPMTRMRTIIAHHMAESAQTAPHVHTVFKVDMTRIVRLREREKNSFEQRNGFKLTYMPFIAVAAVEALRKFPDVNASLEGDSIRYHPNINLGIAVAIDAGLIVPVVKQAEERNFLGLARAIADLATRARGKRLKPEEASGSTFSLTNSGIFGEEFGTPIINQPDSAILGIGGLRKEPVVVTDAQGNDSIAIRSVQYFCLGFDHRLIDGAGAGKFMTEFKKTLENWNQDIG